MPPTLEREAVTISRLLEFFTAKELRIQIGFGPEDWPVALAKELIDNALDACESKGTPSVITAAIDPDRIIVGDNGPGIPPEVVERSFNYAVRVSTNNHYVSPSRGQLGNALKCCWAAPFVLHGEEGLAEVTTRGKRCGIAIRLDRIAQEPRITPAWEPADVKTGTSVVLHWPEEASFPDDDLEGDFYHERSAEYDDVATLLAAYSSFNPHAEFRALVRDQEEVIGAPTAPGWKKWRPDRPTSPYWYDRDKFRDLVAALLANGHGGMTVRDFLRKFDGLAGTKKRREVFEEARPPGPLLSDLVRGNDLDEGALIRLRDSMQVATRPVKPDTLGVLGQSHMAAALVRYWGANADLVKYKRVKCSDPARPFVLEVAFALKVEDYKDAGRDQVVGLNWAPALATPFAELAALLGEMRIDRHDPVSLLVHLACPRIDFTDKGKSRAECGPRVKDALRECIRSVAAGWKQAKLKQENVSRDKLAEMRKAARRPRVSVKEAAYRVMEEAYQMASGNGQDPANARQIMYAARPLVLELTGGKCWKRSSTFTQRHLIGFTNDNPELTEGWDVVFDKRGTFTEPHTGLSVGLGTLEVRKYVMGWHFTKPALDAPKLSTRFPTSGPLNRYRHVLFVEKEGFGPLLARHRIAERYDLAIMSTKGMSVTAARSLVERLSALGVTIFVLHDFDKAGFSIVHTLGHDNARYTFQTKPRVIDLGLRLDQAQEMDLQSERVTYCQEKDPRIMLRERGATEEECAFLVERWEGPKLWSGRRIELNAMTSPQFITFLENQLQAHGVEKFIPDDDVLASAYRRACKLVRLQRLIDRELSEQGDEEIPIPEDLAPLVRKCIQGTHISWDQAVHAHALLGLPSE
jgi:hypothetical protein